MNEHDGLRRHRHWRWRWLGLALILAGGRAPAPASPEREASGALVYAQWLLGALDALTADMDAITASADAAARFYIENRQALRIYGEATAVAEMTGRSGGAVMMGMSHHTRAGTGPLVLYVLREDELDADRRAVAHHHRQGNHVVVFGRDALIDVLAGDGALYASAVRTRAAPNGGLFSGTDGDWVVSTVPAANATALWTWFSEFVAACTRQGEMPTIYEGYHVPGGKHRGLRLTGMALHDDGIRVSPVPAGRAGRIYLSRLREAIQTLLHDDIDAIRGVGLEAARRIAGDVPGSVYAYLHGHSILRRSPLVGDPGYFEQLNSNWTVVRPEIVLRTNDLVFCVGYNQLFRGRWFNDWDAQARHAGVVLAWSIATFLTSEADAVSPTDYLIRQPWSFGDAVVEIPGYDVAIAPSSGVLAETVYGMTVAEVHRLLDHRERLDTDPDRLRGWTRLHRAVLDADPAAARDAIEAGDDIQAADQAGATPLHLAVRMGHDEMVAKLLEAGAHVNAVDRFGRTPLHLAAGVNTNAVIVERLLAADADAGRVNQAGETALHRAARQADSDLLTVLIENAVAAWDVSARDGLHGRTPLHWAALDAHRPAIEALLAAGAAVTSGDRWAMQPIHLAAQGGDLETVRRLVQAGADIHARDQWGRSVLHWAAQEHHRELLPFFLAHGVSPDVRDRYGRSALYDAAGVSANRDTLRLLLDAGADPAVICDRGAPPTVGTWGWVAELLAEYPAHADRPRAAETATGDAGHFLSLAARLYLHNPDGRAFRFDVHQMRWPIAGWSWNRGTFPMRLTDPDGAVVLDDLFKVDDHRRTFERPAGPPGTHRIDFTTADHPREMVNLWLASDLERSVVWTGDPDPGPGAFENRWLVTQPSVPRRWWFWVPAGTSNFVVRTQRDIGNTERETPAITVFTPRGQRIAALFGHPFKAERLWAGDRAWRDHLERRIPVVPGTAGRFWAVEMRLGDAHNYSKINLTLDGIPPYVARSPEEWFNPETGQPAPVGIYDESRFMQSVADESLPFQMWAPSPSLGDPDGIRILGDGRIALWNPDNRELAFDIGDYLVQKATPDAPEQEADIRILDGAGHPILETRLTVPHHHHGARQPHPIPPAGAGVLTLEVSGVARWFAYTYPATPLVWIGQPVDNGFQRFQFEVGTARNWYFWVPAGTRRFEVRAQVQHDTDAMHLEINAPDRTQAILFGRNAAATVEVPEGLDARIWHIRTDIGGATRIVTTGDPAACRYLAILLTLDLKNVPGYLSPTWEQWFHPEQPRPVHDR